MIRVVVNCVLVIMGVKAPKLGKSAVALRGGFPCGERLPLQYAELPQPGESLPQQYAGVSGVRKACRSSAGRFPDLLQGCCSSAATSQQYAEICRSITCGYSAYC